MRRFKAQDLATGARTRGRSGPLLAEELARLTHSPFEGLFLAVVGAKPLVSARLKQYFEAAAEDLGGEPKKIRCKSVEVRVPAAQQPQEPGKRSGKGRGERPGS